MSNNFSTEFVDSCLMEPAFATREAFVLDLETEALLLAAISQTNRDETIAGEQRMRRLRD